MELPKINNIIFDLGGVIIDIDPPRAFEALRRLAPAGPASLFSERASLFLDLERGAIDAPTFYRQFRQLVRQDALEDQVIAEAWNSMLLDIPAERLHLLRKLKKRYRLFVLSNTNDIHVTAFNEMVERVCGEKDLHCFFDQVYFSHEINMRKPDAKIYEWVLQENSLVPEQTLFIDDRPENIAAAAALGIQTYLATPDNNILLLFKDL